MARARPGQRQEPGTQSRSPTGVAGSWSREQSLNLPSRTPIWDRGILSSAVTPNVAPHGFHSFKKKKAVNCCPAFPIIYMKFLPTPKATSKAYEDSCRLVTLHMYVFSSSSPIPSQFFKKLTSKRKQIGDFYISLTLLAQPLKWPSFIFISVYLSKSCPM